MATADITTFVQKIVDAMDLDLEASAEEMPDGLIIEESPLRGCKVQGHGDHRVVMALSVAGMNVPQETEIDTAEAVAVTFPQFADCMVRLGGRIEVH